MALSKSIETQFGIIATYWKIVLTNIDWLGKISHVVIYGYKDEQSSPKYISGIQPLKSLNYNWSGDDFPFPSTDADIRITIYNKIKTNPMYVEEYEEGAIGKGKIKQVITNELYQALDI